MKRVSRRGVLESVLALTVAVAVVCLPGCRRSDEPQEAAPEIVEQPPPERPKPWPAGSEEAAVRIVDAARADDRVMERLSQLVDGIGARPGGSRAMERAVDWALATMKEDGLDSVSVEKVTVSVWERGQESALLLGPGPPRPLAVLGLGRSVGTPAGGITAPLVVVSDFDDLERLGGQVSGKIVLFNFAMQEQENMFASYEQAVQYRWRGAAAASAHGAEAVLVRSPTTRSLRTPHTGAMKPYDEGERPIPAAAVSIEDAEMLQRLYDRGERPEVRLTMGARTLPDRPSANVIGEVRGRELPDELVVIGAHLDSWDVGSGAHDNGTGVVMTIEALRLLTSLDLKPRRSVRGVLFTNEERGLEGGLTYREKHLGELGRHVAAMESDSGGFAPRGFSFEGTDEAAERLQGLLELFAPLGSLALRRGGSGADILPIVEEGVPGLGLIVDSTHYFDYHHTAADTFDKVEPSELKDALAAFTLMTWLLAELPEPLPRSGAQR
ncbi:MAG: M28 family peptidase [Acidobacteriota bacterium]|nr:M28 family peptidase [Acidobacteriota bacterium]